MMKHRLFSFVIAGLLAVSLPLTVLAHDEKDQDAPDSSKTKRESIRSNVKDERDTVKKSLEDFKAKKQASSAERLKALIAYGDRVVSQRQKALEEMEKRISSGSCSKIDAVTKTAILANVTAMKATLASQKTAIDTSTDLETAKAAIKIVFEKNRVFIHFIPALNGICAAQRVIDLVDGKFADAITKLKAANIDTHSLELQLTQARNSALAAQELYKQVAANPGDSGAHAKIDAAAAKLKEAKNFIVEAKRILAAHRDSLKKSDD